MAEPITPEQRLAEIRERHSRASTLAESLPPVIEDWDNGDGFVSGEEVLHLFHETRMGKEAGEFTFALHAWQDVRDLLAEVERLNAAVDLLGGQLQGGAQAARDLARVIDLTALEIRRAVRIANAGDSAAAMKVITEWAAEADWLDDLDAGGDA